jgi:hypothetical protein
MIEIGRWNRLTIIRSKDFGAYLGEKDNPSETVLLPRKQIPEGAKAGTDLDVFIYRDSEDRLIATVNKPLITMDEMAKLKVKNVTPVGAFMDWGLEKDIFLPFKEQTAKVEEGRSYLVRMYADKSNRLCVSMKLYNYLQKLPTGTPDESEAEEIYKKGDTFTGTVYEYKKDMGAFVAIDDRYNGLIHANELYNKVYVGDEVTGRIINIREDGKADLSIRKLAYQQMDEDSEMVYRIIKSYKGVLPFTDKADAELIKKEFGISKNAFKRAVGHLLKEGRVRITDTTIEITELD